jgi:hypothetical protein
VTYRDDHQTLVQFAQHLGVAEELVRQFETIPRRMTAKMSGEQIAQLREEARAAWIGAWDQLTQARDIAVGRGRSVADYDEARRLAADIWVSSVQTEINALVHSVGGYKRTVSWRSAPTKPAKDGIAALRAAVPEAEGLFIAPPTPHVDLSPSRTWWWLVPAVLIGLLVWRFL